MLEELRAKLMELREAQLRNEEALTWVSKHSRAICERHRQTLAEQIAEVEAKIEQTGFKLP